MNRETRIESYRKIYAHLKEVKGLTSFKYSDEQKDLEFQFEGGPFHFHYCLYVNNDRVQIRAVMNTDMDEEKAISVARELSAQMEGMSGTSYDGQIILQSNVIFFGVSDQEAAKMIFDKTCDFVKVVMDYVEREYPETLYGPPLQEEPAQPEEEIEEMSMADKEALPKEQDIMQEEPPAKEDAITHEEKTEEPDVLAQEASDEIKKDVSPSLGSTLGDMFNSVTESLVSAEKPSVERERYEKGKEPEKQPVQAAPEAPDGADDTMDMSDLEGKADLGSPMEAPSNAPEDIKAMYEEMNLTFAMRKEQLDYSDRLIKNQKAYINAEKKQLFKERQDLEAQKKEVEASESKLKSKWNNYNSAKKNQTERESALAEREAKARVASEKIEEKQTSLEGLIESNRMQKDELERLRIKTHEQREMLEEEKDALTAEKKDLEAQREALKKQADELTAKEQKLRLMESQLAMRDKTIRDKMNDLKEMEDMARQMQLPGYKPDPNAGKSLAAAKEEKDKLLKRIQDLENALKESKAVKAGNINMDHKAAMDDLKKAYDALKKDHAELKEMCAVLEKENAALKESISKGASERDREAASLASMEKDIAAMRDRAQKAEDRSKELEAEVKELKDKIAEDTILFDKAKKKIENLKHENAKCIEDLEDAGYRMEEVQGEGDKLFRGTKDEVTFYVNRTVKVLYVEKPAKSKNQRTLSDWNEEDMRFSYAYSLSGKKATCRCVYMNIVEDLGEILTKFDDLK